MTSRPFISFVLYEWPGAGDGVSLGGAEHLLAGPFQTNAAACDWIETQTTISQAAAIP